MIDHVSQSVRERRRFLKLTQGEVAQQAGVSRQTVSMLESNRFSDLGIRKVDRICATLGLQLEASYQSRPTLDDLIAEEAAERG
ncbi:MAG: helix-turn-helix transcriptional regulator [Verrucomicrobia bacterium]|nr:helix-turn-helix transcriptional regulator [Verrucomicrobiota bacterium]